MTSLPSADDVFLRYFAHWYEPGDLARRGHEATRPDLEEGYDAAARAAAISGLTSDDREDAAEQIADMLDAAKGDWPDLVGASGPVSRAWIAAFDEYYDRERVAEVLEASDPMDYSNELIVLCCELGAVLGTVLKAEAPTLEWIHDAPYWESALLDPAHGYRINVFHWAVRKFSADGVADAYSAKIAECTRLVSTGWS